MMCFCSSGRGICRGKEGAASVTGGLCSVRVTLVTKQSVLPAVCAASGLL